MKKIIPIIFILMYCGSVYLIYHSNHSTLWSYISVLILMITVVFLLKIFIKSNHDKE